MKEKIFDMKIEAVTVCVNYSDYLAHTLPFNKYIFDHLTVVTTPDDKDTANVCEFYHIQCVKTNAFGKDFNKARGINVGLSYLSRSDWICIFDSDILFLPRSRYLLEIAGLQKDCLYSAHRMMCPSYEAFAEWLVKPTVETECDIYLHNKSFPLGTQIGKLTKDPKDPADLGWTALGYLQIFNENGGPHKYYPENHPGFATSDLQFSYNWPRHKRILIPEFNVLHLSTDDNDKMGKNWNGRNTKRFGPAVKDINV